jgi:carboxypeptidase family protein
MASKTKFIIAITFSILLSIGVFYSCSREVNNPLTIEPPQYEKKLFGFVKDSVLNRSIAGAELTSFPDEKTVFTDSSGYFEFNDLNEDEYVIVINRQYFRQDSITVDLISNDTLEVNFNLKRVRAEFYNFELNFAEGYTDNLTPEIPKIYLNMRTEVNFNCSNYAILTQNSFQNNLVGINFVRIDLPGGVCLTSIGPATSRIPFNVSPNNYSISIFFEDVEDKYDLLVTDTSLTAQSVETYFTKLDYNKYWRKPVNSFVYLCGTSSRTDWIYNDFIDTLKSKVSITELFFPEDGVKPYASSTSGHEINHPARYFNYDNDADFESMGLILENYSTEVIGNSNGVAVSLRNWKNQFFYSWDKN